MSLARRAVLSLALAALASPVLGQVRLPEPGGGGSDGWLTMHRGPFGEWKIEPASLDLRADGLAYRINDSSYAPPRWITARCDTGERAEIAQTLRWSRPAHGTWAELDLLYACSLARQRGLAVDRVPAWRDDEVLALVDAWTYSAGTSSIDWRVAYFASEAEARRGRLQRWGDKTRYAAPTLHARSLLDVPPHFRRPLAGLWSANQRSPVLALRGVQGEPEWAVLEFIARGPLERPSDAQDFRRHAAHWVGEGLVDPPAALLASPLHRARASYRRALSPADLVKIDDTLSPNLHYGDDLTPLTLAVLTGNEPLARALLDRGADPNLCGRAGCPLHTLTLLQQDTARLAWAHLLLRAGARPDGFDNEFSLSDSTPLGSAAFAGDRPVAERLVSAGASPDGAPGVRHTPLELALSAGKRDMAQWLIAQGASVLPLPDRSERDPERGEFGRGNAWRAAREARDDALLAWIEAQMLQAAQASPRFAVEASVEQDGKRQPLVDGRSIALRAAPFRLVFRLGGDDAPGVVVASSFSPAFAAAAKRQERSNGLLIPSRSSALANAPEPGSYELLAFDPPAEGRPEGEPWGAHMFLSPDATTRRDFHAQHGREFVREVRAIGPVPDQGTAAPALDMAALKGRRLALVFGSTLLLDPIEWAPWVKAQAVTLNFH